MPADWQRRNTKKKSPREKRHVTYVWIARVSADFAATAIFGDDHFAYLVDFHGKVGSSFVRIKQLSCDGYGQLGLLCVHIVGKKCVVELEHTKSLANASNLHVDLVAIHGVNHYMLAQEESACVG